MIALGSYEGTRSTRTTRTRRRTSAEVAFLVEDAQQGRGIGQLLLEHLAQAGRERGIERFVAEVLPDNQRMIQTFRDAGYRLVSGYEDGVITLEFPIEPTDTAIGVMVEPRAPRRGGVDREVLQPAVGRGDRRLAAARTPSARRWCATWSLGDYTGRVYVVNPTAKSVSGLPAYSTRRRHPRRRRRRDRRRARRGGAGRRARLRRQGRARPGRHLVGLRRDRRGGPAAAAPAGRAVPLLRPAPDRPELPRHHQHRPRRSA